MSALNMIINLSIDSLATSPFWTMVFIISATSQINNASFVNKQNPRIYASYKKW